MLNLTEIDYRLGVGALIVALLIAIIVWTIAYIEYRKLVRQRRIDWLVRRIRERAEDSGNESEGIQRSGSNGGYGESWALDVNDV
uniref:Protein Vpu n=1 Tax=Human immunodeficiency virus type 1 TaxID=11676 RepID=G8I169_HV1|nr:vpu protein [Human immunodeficiency virus 1]